MYERQEHKKSSAVQAIQPHCKAKKMTNNQMIVCVWFVCQRTSFALPMTSMYLLLSFASRYDPMASVTWPSCTQKGA